MSKSYLTNLIVFCNQGTGLVDECRAVDVDYLDNSKFFHVVSYDWIYREEKMTGTEAQGAGRLPIPWTVKPQWDKGLSNLIYPCGQF